ncbi:MAG: hypothetical protein IPO92_00340 [Saprospiraceae bacterium]|nr:hypothetical protein [Saprospiraceae bacterium]
MKKFIPLIFILIAAVALLSYYMYNKPHAETKDAMADVVISPAELLASYELDETKADQMYLDKIIEVKGSIKAINNLTGGSSIALDTGNEMASVICEFESPDAIKSVKVGDVVKVKGFCTGKLSDIILTRCSM